MAKQVVQTTDDLNTGRIKINANFDELYAGGGGGGGAFWPLEGSDALTNDLTMGGGGNNLTLNNYGTITISANDEQTIILDNGVQTNALYMIGSDMEWSITEGDVVNAVYVSQSNISLYSTDGVNRTTTLNLGYTDNGSTIQGFNSTWQGLRFIGDTANFVDTSYVTKGWVDINTSSYDYTINKIGSTFYAFPKKGSALSLISDSDAYTVIQGAIDALTVSGSQGSGGGDIYICSGLYPLTDELIIDGWEGAAPFSSLKITGAGKSTIIRQGTSAKHALIIKNRACVDLFDLRIETNGSARAAIYGDNTGSNETSIMRGKWDNLFLYSESTSYPALHLINLQDLDCGRLYAQNTNYHAIILQQNSTTTNFGNSKFGYIRALASDSSPYAGLAIIDTLNSRRMNLLEIGSFHCDGFGYYGIATSYASNIVFNHVDIENVPVCIGLGVLGTTSSNETLNVKFNSGYLLPNTGGKGIFCSEYTGANTFEDIWIDGDATAIPIDDDQQFRNPNSYSVHYGFDIVAANTSIITSTFTPYTYTSNSKFKTYKTLPVGTVEDNLVRQLQALGSTIKATTIGIPYLESNVYGANIDENGIHYIAVYLARPATITGVKTVMHTQGSYTAGTYNGVGLYSVSGTTLTRVASSTNDGNIWKASSGSLITKAFSTPYSAEAGLYYIAVQHQRSANVTAPQLSAMPPGVNIYRTLDFTGGHTLMAIAYNDSALPSTKASNSDFNVNDPIWAALY